MKRINRMVSLIFVAGAFIFGVDNIDNSKDAISKESIGIMAVQDPGGGGGH